MSLQEKSEELKSLISIYDSKWLLGDLKFLIHAGIQRAQDQLGELSSPMRQLIYLAGINLSTGKPEKTKFWYDAEIWQQVVKLLNEIEDEYEKVVLGTIDKENFDNWESIRQVTIPSFFSYFNEGHLNYKEQILNWIVDLFSPYDKEIEAEINLRTIDFIAFYKNLSKLYQNNFQAFSTRPELLKDNWEEYSFIGTKIDERVPKIVRDQMPKEYKVYSKFGFERGIKDRFFPSELISDNLSKFKIELILDKFSCVRADRSFLYYTEQKPGNPISNAPILKLDNGMFQLFDDHQLLYQIRQLLEQTLLGNKKINPKYIKAKGDLLENNIADLFKEYLGDKAEVFCPYYVDGKEQDILILWEKSVFIIESKAYNIREPLRSPEKAFPRIRDDFNEVIGYAYTQTSRIEKFFINGDKFSITDSKGNTIKVVDPTEYENDFSIIVNQHTFGSIQINLAHLLKLKNDDDEYPWAIQYDDLEIFILTLIQKKKNPKFLIDFLLFREQLHGKIICSDELEICGGFMQNKFRVKAIKYQDNIKTDMNYADIFDKQYHKGMGLNNEEYLDEKRSGNFIVW